MKLVGHTCETKAGCVEKTFREREASDGIRGRLGRGEVESEAGGAKAGTYVKRERFERTGW